MPRISSSDDCKREAVRLVTEDGHSRKQVARELGISAGSLRDWIHRFAPAGQLVSDKLPEAEQIPPAPPRECPAPDEARHPVSAVGIFS